MPVSSIPKVDLSQQAIPCRVCGEAKPKSEFYDQQVRKDLSAGECKECTKDRVRRRSQTDPKVQEYDRRRAKTPERRKKAREITRRWRAENPAGYKAHSAVSSAIREGRLEKQPCVFCEREDVHAHHRDYSKPLEVIWLCPRCHHRLHHLFPETEGANK